MKVFERKEGEAIEIGDDIVIVVIRSGRKVKIGVQAPGLRVRVKKAVDRPEAKSIESSTEI